MIKDINPDVIEVDIHNMYYDEAKIYLTDILDNEGKYLKEIIVIHGYRGGQTLQKLVREDLVHPRIQKRIVGLNKGQTTLLLGSKKNK